MKCLSAAEIETYIADGATGRFAEHVDRCDSCRRGVAAAVRARPLPAVHSVGRYIIMDELGAGGMGVVYRAFDPELGRHIAVKRLLAQSPEAKTRLGREARALAALSHPNVVTIHDIGSEADDTFIAMELVAGTTLRKWLASPRAVDEIVGVFRQAAMGLAAAHRSGLVHRDFKPENVFVRDDGRVQVGDFGLARASGTVSGPATASALADVPFTQSGALLGTVPYMAPEQLRGEPADARSDQFSFCVALFEALSGTRPFAGATVSALAASFEKAPELGRIPRWLRDPIARGLAIDATRRFATMDVYVRALRDPRRRRRSLAAVAGAVLVASAATAVIAVRASTAAAPCPSARPRLAGVWDPVRAAAVQAAFLATGRSFAPQAWITVRHMLDDHAAQWVGAAADACKATRVEGRQSEHVLDLRIACLDRRLVELDVLVDRFVAADSHTVERAARAIGELAPIAVCADQAALEAPTPLPGPAITGGVAQVRHELAHAEALRATGDLAGAMRVIAPAVDTAGALGYAPVHAEALLARGGIESDRLKALEAGKSFGRAIDTAEAGHDDVVKADAWIGLVLVATQRAQYNEAHDNATHARAVLARLGPGHDASEARLDRYEATVYLDEHDNAKTLALGQRALARVAAESLDAAEILHVVGEAHLNASENAKARAALEHSLAIRKRILGDRHPAVADADKALAMVLANEGAHDAAQTLFEEALAICDSAFGPKSLRSAEIRSHIGMNLVAGGHIAEGITASKAALAVLEPRIAKDHPLLAQLHYTIGHAYLSLDDAAHAEPELARAYELRRDKFGEDDVATLEARAALGEVAALRKDIRGARLIFEAVLARQVNTLGPDDPALSQTHLWLGDSLQTLGAHRDALAHFERAAALDEKALGPSHINVAADLLGVGEEKFALHDTAGAVAALERALAIANTSERVDIRAEGEYALAKILWRSDRARALSLARAARDIYAAGGKSANLADVVAWLHGKE